MLFARANQQIDGKAPKSGKATYEKKSCDTTIEATVATNEPIGIDISLTSVVSNDPPEANINPRLVNPKL